MAENIEIDIDELRKIVQGQRDSRKRSIRKGINYFMDGDVNEECYDIGFINGMALVLDYILGNDRFGTCSYLNGDEIKSIAEENKKLRDLEDNEEIERLHEHEN